MNPEDASRENLARAVRELGAAIKQDARERWKGVRTAHRRERSREVWRFRTREDAKERFLHVPQGAMMSGRDAAATVMGQLRDAGWLDRLQHGPESSFLLSPAGTLQPWPKE
jgi:hypothetical protein